MRLFHKDVFFPYIKPYMVKWFVSDDITVSRHLKRHLHSHKGRYKYTIEDCLNVYYKFCQNPKSVNLFEVGYEGKFLRKICFRSSLDKENDLALVIIKRKNQSPLLVTAWLNKRTDTHNTLNLEKYCTKWK